MTWRRCLKTSRSCFTSRFRSGLWFGFQQRWLSSESQRRFAVLWGNGDYGRLGLGSLDSQWEPAVCPAFEKESLRAIACGGAHSLFLTETGRVYASGLNDFGQLGISDERGYILEPVEVTGLNKDIIQISAGYYHSSAITGTAKIVPEPTRVESLAGINIKMIALGSEHSIAVTEEGEALSWGEGGCGRLGHCHQSSILGFLSSKSEYTPRLIKMPEAVKVKYVAAGLLHSVCIDENGSVFIFDERAINKLDFGEANNTIMSKLPLSEMVACGGYHTCVITSDGELYTWGSNENGCLGIGSMDVVHMPERVEGPFLKSPVCKVSCGWKHTAAISGGDIFTWGWGGSHGTFSVDGQSSGGQLGQGNDVDYYEPKMVNFDRDVRALQVSCGFNHTGAILEYT
ncbi:probable E3 ubiquitin-protein ligase HERC4 isoform X2 [Telopea speciosissima]|uniref:probable E3 ubiquitin-protein ligase HERC4 isoform X2 n=1 Tax=Telopea speciosissima TaxID=54955 RepID=UPI001CC6C958|nr:probable E3 ubiquitin-protein ligase HERC4 isoform X2 [Telopea speciosissima]